MRNDRLLGLAHGDYDELYPLNHVNMAQSNTDIRYARLATKLLPGFLACAWLQRIT